MAANATHNATSLAKAAKHAKVAEALSRFDLTTLQNVEVAKFIREYLATPGTKGFLTLLERSDHLFWEDVIAQGVELVKCVWDDAYKVNVLCHYAIKHDRKDVLEWIHSRREEEVVEDGQLLCTGVMYGKRDLLPLFVKWGAKWDIDQGNGHRLGHYDSEAVALWGDLDALKLALEYGCPIDEYMFQGAVESGSVELVEFLYYQQCPHHDNEEYIVCKAIQYNHVKVLQFLFDHGFSFFMNACSIAKKENAKECYTYLRSVGFKSSPSTCKGKLSHKIKRIARNTLHPK